ncbi:GntR family galactonate operon transcriptional repressor [Devosia sp. UYZn731]|uniref:FadR/GntR family transcriptional regulator n=1 Tax=Devosia sp. UYZn731 TaxID=3156345 RepID=UPI003397FC81
MARSAVANREEAHLGGLMQVRGILGSVVSGLGRRIVAGEWKSGEALPTEAELMDELNVGRSVVRESIRILNAKGLVRSRQMAGTTVLPRAEWRLLDPDLIQWRMQAADRKVLLKDLLQVRLTLEPGVVWTATANGSASAKERIHRAWQAKIEVLHERSTPEQQRLHFIEHDLEFHRAFLAAVGSEILEQLFSVIEAALSLMIDVQMQARGSTTALVGMEETNQLHQDVYDAFAAGDADKAEKAMRFLIQSAIIDANRGFSLTE